MPLRCFSVLSRFAEGTSRYEIAPAFFQPFRSSHVSGWYATSGSYVPGPRHENASTYPHPNWQDAARLLCVPGDPTPLMIVIELEQEVGVFDPEPTPSAWDILLRGGMSGQRFV